MTKRKRAPSSVTTHNLSTARNPLVSSETLHSSSSAQQPSVKKTNVIRKSVPAAVASLSTAKDLDIDDIFKQARSTKRVSGNTEKVCTCRWGRSSSQDCR